MGFSSPLGGAALAGGYASLQQQISQNVGSIGLPGAFGASLQPNAANTTTAVNLTIVVNGVPQGLIRSMSVDEQFNVQRVRVIGSAVDVAMVPGVYEATAQINKAFLYGVTLETAFGGGIRAVVGKYQADADFTKFYFNILEVDNLGRTLATRHDCMLTSIQRAYEIDQVVVFESASLLIRWTDGVQ